MLLNLFSAVIISLHHFPLGANSKNSQKQVKKVANKDDKIEFVWVDGVLFVLVVKMRACINFEGVFCILSHKHQEDHDESEKSSNIREGLVNFLKPTIDNNSCTWSSHDDIGVGLTLCLFGDDLGKIIDDGSYLLSVRLVWQYALVCGYFEFGNEYVE